MARRQTPPVESLAKPAIVAAVLVAVAQFVLSLLNRLLRSNAQVDFVDVLLGELIGIIGDAALFGAVLAVFAVGSTVGLLLRAGAVLYVAQLIENVLSTLNNQFAQIQPAILVGPLFTVVFFLGFVMTFRIYQGETVLPGVDFRL